jgi:hypothetical protein
MLRKHWQDRGLGLAGMQERAALLDGAVEIESEPGAGALITVTIPLRQAGRSRPSPNTHLTHSHIEAPLMELEATPELRLMNIAQVEPQIAPQPEMG